MRLVGLPPSRRVWIFDLDNTLHDAQVHIFPSMHDQINAYLMRRFGVDAENERLEDLFASAAAQGGQGHAPPDFEPGAAGRSRACGVVPCPCSVSTQPPTRR